MIELTKSHASNGTQFIIARGQLTHSTMLSSDEFDAIFEAEIFKQNVVANFAEVEIVDSSGIGWILTKNRKFREYGGKLILHSLHPNVKKVFAMMKLGDVIRLAEDENEASATLENAGAGHE